jgi:hypothetical protein
MIEVISENVNDEEDEDYLILEHFAKLEKLAESNPHTPSEMIKVFYFASIPVFSDLKSFEKYEINNNGAGDADEKVTKWGGSDPVGRFVYS